MVNNSVFLFVRINAAGKANESSPERCRNIERFERKQGKTGTSLLEQNEVMGQQIGAEGQVSIRHLIYLIQ